MNAPVAPENGRPHSSEQKLMTHGTVFLQQPPRWVEVRRGMIVKSSEGLVVGQVAAIVVNARDEEPTHFLLTRLTVRPDYRLVPLDLIREVRAETLRLSVDSAGVIRLRHWSGAGERAARFQYKE